MRRRDFIQAMISAVIAPRVLWGQASNPVLPPPAPVPWTLGLNPATPVPKTEIAEVVAQTELHFFTPAQMATLSRLSDVLLPPIGSKPGALAAGVPSFLDFLIGSSPSDRKQMYQAGLDWMEAEARRQFGKPFAQLDTVQIDRLIKPWLRTWMPDHPPIETHADFINIVHDDIREATINSKEWSEAPAEGAQQATPVGLYWSPIEPDVYEDRLVRLDEMRCINGLRQ